MPSSVGACVHNLESRMGIWVGGIFVSDSIAAALIDDLLSYAQALKPNDKLFALSAVPYETIDLETALMTKINGL